MKARITELLAGQNELRREPASEVRGSEHSESNGDDWEFVRDAFHQILGREPELDALLYFSKVLTTESRETVLEFLKQSEEACLRNAPDRDTNELEDLCSVEPHRRFLIAAYARVFRRLVDPTGLAAYLHKLENGFNREQVLIELCSSAEGRAQNRKMRLKGRPIEELFEAASTDERLENSAAGVALLTVEVDPLLQIEDPKEFLYAVYQSVFRREPDAGGLSYWLAVLDKQTSKYSVLFEMSHQAEAKMRGVVFRFRGAPIEKWELSDLDVFAAPGRFVWEAFRRILYRDCTVDEFLPLLELLHFGLPRAQVLAAIAARSAASGEQYYYHGQALSRADLPFSVRLRARVRRLLGTRRADVLDYTTCTHFSLMEERLRDLHNSGRKRLENLESAISSAQRSMIRLHEKLDTVRSELKVRIDSLDRSTVAHPIAPVLSGSDVFVTKVDDFILAIPRENWRLAASYAYWGTVERGLGQRFRQLLRPGMTVVDVGANVGIYTLHAARAVGDSGKVFSFEPAPKTFATLKRNVDANGFSARVELRSAAVLDKSSRMPLYVRDEDCGLNSLYMVDGARSEMVETVSLDEALAGVASIDIIKIDAEGAEPRILRGMQRVIGANPGLQIFIEFAPSLLLRGGVQPADFLDQLLKLGFDIQIVDDLNGELLRFNRASLLSAFSVNLSLRRTVA